MKKLQQNKRTKRRQKKVTPRPKPVTASAGPIQVNQSNDDRGMLQRKFIVSGLELAFQNLPAARPEDLPRIRALLGELIRAMPLTPYTSEEEVE